MDRIDRIVVSAAFIVAISAPSVGFAQQDPSRSQEAPAGSGMMQGGRSMMGGGMRGMDCQGMMQGRGSATSGAATERKKQMTERCRNMMGQAPSSGSSMAPTTRTAPENKK